MQAYKRPEESKLIRVRAKGNISSDGKDYKPGDVLEVTIHDARALARAGAIELSPVLDQGRPSRNEEAQATDDQAGA